MHGACLAVGEDAFLVTARTDTGKTTTSLRMLDSDPYSFLSDDLTLVSPDGRVLTYPKPLTISRHTLSAVKTPLLSRRERLGLVVQSRLHSRSGRRFALILARTHLPAATINAVVQMLVPPPKYHVERLVPDVEVAPEAQPAGMVVIERGGEGEVAPRRAAALDTLMRNCEDAYGFPPYAAIEGSLRSRNGTDLKEVERAIVASALSAVPGHRDAQRDDGLVAAPARGRGRWALPRRERRARASRAWARVRTPSPPRGGGSSRPAAARPRLGG